MKKIHCIVCGIEFQPNTARHVYCSKSCSDKKISQTKAASRSGGPGKGWSKGAQTVPRQTCEVCGSSFYAPPIQIVRGGGKFCSNDCRFEFMSSHPEHFPQTKPRRGNGGKRKDLGDRYFRSNWEANYARYLNWLCLNNQISSWQYEVDTFKFPIKRGSRFYTPDFKVWKNTREFEYHEVKGYMDQKSKTKLERMARYYPSLPIILIDHKAYSNIGKAMSRILPGWEFREKCRDW